MKRDTEDQNINDGNEELTFEPDAENTNPLEVTKKLRERLKVCEKEKEEYLTGWQRAKADFVNARKEEEGLRGDLVKFSGENILRDILPVLDSFDMAFGDRVAWEKADKAWRTGIEYIHAQLLSVLSNHGIKQINPIGEPFRPEEHEAIEIIETGEKEKDNIIDGVISQGYSLHGKTLRAAKVKVFHYKQ